MNNKLYLLAVLTTALALGATGCTQKPVEPPATKRAAPRTSPPKVDPPKAADSVTITKKALQVGAKRVSLEKGGMSFVLNAGARQLKMDNTFRQEKEEEVLAVQGNVVTKLKVTFKTMITIEHTQGKDKKEVSPLAGKAFVLEAKTGNVVVTDEKGKATSKKLADLVRKKYSAFGKPDKIFESVPTTPIQVGQKVDALAKGIQASFEQSFAKDKATWSLSGVEVSLKEVREVKGVKLAVFSLKMTMSVQQGKNFTMTMRLKGEFNIRAADGQHGGMSVKGPMDVMGQENAGSMQRAETYIYQ